jgi:hypothetical protein
MRDKSIAFFKTDFGVGLINGGIAGFATARVQSVVYNAAIMASAATAGSVALGYMERDDVFSNARDMTSKAYSIYENNEEGIRTMLMGYADDARSFVVNRKGYAAGAVAGYALGGRL